MRFSAPLLCSAFTSFQFINPLIPPQLLHCSASCLLHAWLCVVQLLLFSLVYSFIIYFLVSSHTKCLGYGERSRVRKRINWGVGEEEIVRSERRSSRDVVSHAESQLCTEGRLCLTRLMSVWHNFWAFKRVDKYSQHTCNLTPTLHLTCSCDPPHSAQQLCKFFFFLHCVIHLFIVLYLCELVIGEHGVPNQIIAKWIIMPKIHVFSGFSHYLLICVVFVLFAVGVCCCFHGFLVWFHRVVVRQKWRKTSSTQTLSIHHRRSPIKKERSPLVKPHSKPQLLQLQLRLRQQAWTRRKI